MMAGLVQSNSHPPQSLNSTLVNVSAVAGVASGNVPVSTNAQVIAAPTVAVTHLAAGGTGMLPSPLVVPGGSTNNLSHLQNNNNNTPPPILLATASAARPTSILLPLSTAKPSQAQHILIQDGLNSGGRLAIVHHPLQQHSHGQVAMSQTTGILNYHNQQHQLANQYSNTQVVVVRGDGSFYGASGAIQQQQPRYTTGSTDAQQMMIVSKREPQLIFDGSGERRERVVSSIQTTGVVTASTAVPPATAVSTTVVSTLHTCVASSSSLTSTASFVVTGPASPRVGSCPEANDEPQRLAGDTSFSGSVQPPPSTEARAAVATVDVEASKSRQPNCEVDLFQQLQNRSLPETKDTNNDAADTQDGLGNEEQAEIDVVINNVVCSFSVGCHLNLRQIALTGANVEFRRESGMVSMKLRSPYTTASIWSSGKITCTGATSETTSKLAARRYARVLQKLGFRAKFKNFKIVNVLGTCTMPFAIKLVPFSRANKPLAQYEPELHPGVTYKIRDIKATLKIFATGSITVTAPSVVAVQQSIERIYPLVLEHRKTRTSPEDMPRAHNPLANSSGNRSVACKDRSVLHSSYQALSNGVYLDIEDEDEEDVDDVEALGNAQFDAFDGDIQSESDQSSE